MATLQWISTCWQWYALPGKVLFNNWKRVNMTAENCNRVIHTIGLLLSMVVIILVAANSGLKSMVVDLVLASAALLGNIYGIWRPNTWLCWQAGIGCYTWNRLWKIPGLRGYRSNLKKNQSQIYHGGYGYWLLWKAGKSDRKVLSNITDWNIKYSCSEIFTGIQDVWKFSSSSV